MRNKRQRNQSEAARRKTRTVIMKVHEYGKLPGVHVALLVYHNRRYTTYRSIKKRNWPLSMEEIVSSTLNKTERSCSSRYRSSYPLPTNLLPHDVDAELQVRRSNMNHRTTLSQANSRQSRHEGAVQLDMEHEG
jgi:hypothetical protein